jgi:hypothetical protein
MERAIPAPSPARWRRLAAVAALGLAGCAAAPLKPFSTDTAPLILVTASVAGVTDQRGRFREIYCAVLSRDAVTVPDQRPCDEALTRVGREPPPSGQPVSSGPVPLRALLVPGVGFDCVGPWLHIQGEGQAWLRRRGIALDLMQVDSLSSSERNARHVRDAVMAMSTPSGAPDLVLIGYSKGTPDIMEAVVAFPEIRPRLAAVVSVAGAVGGSPLADDSADGAADLMRYFPGAKCGPGDGGAVVSLRTGPRQAWLAANPLPTELRTYTVATLPQPDAISLILKPFWNRLAQIDPRNDGQLIFYDQVVPGSTLLGYLNADHWAVAVPIARAHPTIAALFVTRNAYPREAMIEAVLRAVAEDLPRATGSRP